MTPEKPKSSPSVRVLFVNRPETFTVPGGDTTHLVRLKEALERRGAHVDVACEYQPDATGYDLINIFNLLLPSQTMVQARALRARTHAPIFLTPFYWDTSESVWGEAVVPQAVTQARTAADLERALREIAAGTRAAGNATRAGRNRPYADCESHQQAALDHVDHVIPISQPERILLAERFQVSHLGFTVIPTGVDLPDHPASPEPFVKRYGVRDFVLTSGRVEPRKNQLLLLLALRDAGLPIVIAGAHPDPAYLKLCLRVAPGSTYFVGRLEPEMLASARAAARVHALTSWWETAGIASMEAAFAGCNVVMGNRAAEPEYFGESAYYCDPADATSIRQAVLAAYESHPADAPRRAELQARLRARHSWDAVSAQTLEAYQSALQQSFRPDATTWATRRTRREMALAHLASAEDALRLLEPYIRPGSTNSAALLLAGQSWLKLKRPEEARTALQAAAALAPDDHLILRVLVEALIQTGDLSTAGKHLRHALEAHPDDAGLLWLSALIAPAAAAGARQEPARPTETSGAPREVAQNTPGGPLFSVLVPTRDQARLLPAALDSLLSQTCPRWEAIVVDDGSTDGTPEVAAACARRDPRIRVVRKPHGGMAAALNAGLRQARGEWICWLPADGLFEPDKLAIHLAAIQAMPEIMFFHTRHLELNELTGVRSMPDVGSAIPPADLQLVRLFHTNYIHGASIAVHRSVFERVGGFNEKRRHTQDLDMWLRLGARFTSHFIDRCTCVRRVHSSPDGARLPDAGTLESASACQDFLNTHTFADLFPRLNLSRAESIPQALQAVLLIALDPDALINQGGHAPALIGRMREWLSRSCPLELRPSVLAEYGRITQAARDSSRPAWIKRALVPVHEAAKPHRYRPADPLVGLERHGAVRRAAGDVEAASAIDEYVQARRGVGGPLTQPGETPGTADEAPGDGSSRTAASTEAPGPEEPAMPRPLRVLMVTHDASLDGTQAHTWAMAQELIRRGHQVCVARAEHDPARPSGALASAEHQGVPILRVALDARPRPDVESALTGDGGLSTLRGEFQSESGAAALEQVLGAFEPDLVHFHDLLGFSAAALPACTRRGVPTVLTLHDDWTLCEERLLLHANDTPCSGPETAGKCARCFLEYHPALDGARFLGPVTDHMQTRQDYLHVALEQANNIIVPTQFQLQLMIRYGYEPARLRLQPPGIRPFDPLPRQPAAGATIAAAGTQGDRLRFVMLGAIAPREGLDLAIHAFNLAAPRNASLEIHGENTAPEFLRQIMAQVNPGVQVFYRGPCTGDELPKVLAHADVGIVPPRAGHGGPVMREFLHAGVPVIAPALPGINEIIRDGQNGLLFRPNDVGSLAEKITLLAGQPARLESLRQGITPVRTLAEEATDLEALYREVHRRGASAQPASPAAIPVPSRAAETLQWLFDAPDIAAALRQHVERLDGDLLALVQANARSARAEYKTELARGLDSLAAHIVQITGARAAGKRPLTIVAFSSEKPDDSCARLRALAPLGRQAGFRVQWGVRFEERAVHVNTEAIGSADLILIQRFFPSPETQPALDRIFASGKPVLYDLDDLLIDVPATNPYAKVARRLTPHIMEAISRADAVTVSSEELRSAILPHHSRVTLLPNLLDESQWPEAGGEPDPAASVVIGYSGTPTHQADLALVEKALERIARKYGGRVTFCFMGCATDRLLRLPGASVRNFVDYDAYLRALQEAKISIALAPLTDTRFNRCKSNIKWLEYSAAGIAGVYSDLPPYNDCVTPGETGLLAGATAADWFDAIDDLVAHPEKRRRIAAAARQKVMTEYTLAARAHLWGDVYRGALERKQASAATLKLLLVARDLPAALEAHAARLDSDLLRLAHALASSAHANGSTELAEGLSALAAAIHERLGAQARDASPPPRALRAPTSASAPPSGGQDLYSRWRAAHDRNEQDPHRLQAGSRALENQPGISILTPVYNVDARWLEHCVRSVVSQLYPNWELCLVDDGSTRAETLQALEALKDTDPRIRVETLPANQGISAATNAALRMATGEFVALLDNDDELAPEALLEVAALLDRHPEADFIYSDEDKLDARGQRCEPFFKPDWSPELLRSYAYTCHLTVVRKALVEEVGGFRSDYDGAQDYDLTLRVSEQTKNIFHIPRVLYHWRKIAGSAADRVDAKQWGLGAARRALADHARRVSPGAEVLPADGAPGCFRVRHRIHGSPLVSILIPTRGQASGKSPDVEELLYRCVRSIANQTDYRNYEVLVAYNNSLDPEIAAFFEHRPHRLLNYPLSGRFNFPHKLNWMARQAHGEHLVIFNDDLEVISPDWLTALLEFSQQEQVGAVGSKLLYPDGRLQHVGMALGINGYPAHLFHQAPAGHPGYMAHANLIRNYSAVTGAAMMMRRALYDELGGLSEEFSVDYNDTDLCLRLLQKGYRVVYTPYSLLHHHESAVLSGGRLNQDETALFRQRWKDILANDPLYNPNLTRTRLDCGLDVVTCG